MTRRRHQFGRCEMGRGKMSTGGCEPRAEGRHAAPTRTLVQEPVRTHREVSLYLSVVGHALREHMDALRLGAQPTFADPVAHSLARLEPEADDFRDMHE